MSSSLARLCVLPLAMVALLVLLPSVGAWAAQAERVRIIFSGDAKEEYILAMLDLALKRSGKTYRVVMHHDEWSTARMEVSLTEGDVDLYWSATSLDLERQFLPVRVPLFKGLMGYRILMVRSSDSQAFASVQSLDDLRGVVLGQGYRWADTRILESNGLRVEKVIKHESLFHMLDGGRFDAFPRSLLEPWSEMRARPELDLAVEPHLLLKYTMPYYFFVSPTRPALAEDIRRGLEAALADGSFDALFRSNAAVQDALRRTDLSRRRVIEIDNPISPPETPIDMAHYWFDPSLVTAD